MSHRPTGIQTDPNSSFFPRPGAIQVGLPCSGSGGMGRNPKKNEIQQTIGLRVLAECCKEGGAFCSRENSPGISALGLEVSWESPLRPAPDFPQSGERQTLLSCLPLSGVSWKLKAFSSLPPLLQANQLWHLTSPQPLRLYSHQRWLLFSPFWVDIFNPSTSATHLWLHRKLGNLEALCH